MTFVVIRTTVHDRYYLRLKGLDENKKYLNEQTGQVLSGRTLMRAGICIQDKMKEFESIIYRYISVD